MDPCIVFNNKNQNQPKSVIFNANNQSKSITINQKSTKINKKQSKFPGGESGGNIQIASSMHSEMLQKRILFLGAI